MLAVLRERFSLEAQTWWTLGRSALAPARAEAKNKIGQRRAKVLGEGHVGSGVGFGDTSLFCDLELVRDLRHCGDNLVETRCIDRRNMAEDGGCSAARPSPEHEVGDRRLGSVDAHVVVGAIDCSSCFPKVDDGLVADWTGGMQGQNNLGPESLEGHRLFASVTRVAARS